MDTVLFERGEKLYIVGPVTPLTADLGQGEEAELAYAKSVRDFAPNELIGWMRGQYVEADRPNRNGAEWSAGELAIKHVTARMMPVTVMHDPRTAVGLLADTKLVLPSENDKVEVARIDSTLGIWRHRFPEAWEEAQENYRQGSLMQSMECLKEFYDCSECGQRYPCLPGGAEEKNWCSHLRGEESARAARRLGNVTFTGTGLIYGTRGAKGALDTAHLENLQEEVAEFHEKAHRDDRHKPKPQTPRSSRNMEITDKEYQDLLADRAERDQLKSRVDELAPEAAKVADLEKRVETEEAAKVAAEKERDGFKQQVEQANEQARATTLASDRLKKLGKDFKGKLGEFARERLEEQAKSLSDEDWDVALKDREDMLGVKRDAGGEGEPAGAGAGELSAEELAAAGRSSTGGNNGNSDSQAPEARRSVVAGLLAPSKK